MRNRILIIGILMLLTINIAAAIPTIQWIVPQQDGETIAEYPTQLRAYVYDTTSNIQSCTLNMNGQNYTNLAIDNPKIEYMSRPFTLGDGSYTATLNCSNGTTSTSASKTFTIDQNVTYAEQSTKYFKLIVLALFYAGIFAIWAKMRKEKEKIYMIACDVFLIMIGVYATTIHQDVIMWIPIAIGAILLLFDIIEAMS